MTPPRRPTVSYLLRCLDSDEEIVAFTWQKPKELSAALRKDGVSEYHITKLKALIKAGEGKEHRAKPWLQVGDILMQYR